MLNLDMIIVVFTTLKNLKDNLSEIITRMDVKLKRNNKQKQIIFKLVCPTKEALKNKGTKDLLEKLKMHAHSLNGKLAIMVRDEYSIENPEEYLCSLKPTITNRYYQITITIDINNEADFQKTKIWINSLNSDTILQIKKSF